MSFHHSENALKRKKKIIHGELIPKCSQVKPFSIDYKKIHGKYQSVWKKSDICPIQENGK